MRRNEKIRRNEASSGPRLYSLAIPVIVVALLAVWTASESIWLADATPGDIELVVTSDQASIVALDGMAAQRDRSADTRLTAVLSAGSQVETPWYYDLTPAEVEAQVQQHVAERISRISAYWSGSGLRFAVIFVPNRGANAVDWWWFHGQTADDVRASLAQRGATLTDIEGYVTDSGTLYAGVMQGAPKKAGTGN